MIKDVLIKICGVQGIDDQSDTIEFTTDGKFGVKDNEFFISYEEGQMFEEKMDVKTKIFLKKDSSVVLERKGAINSKMLIKEGERNACLYNTPIGDLFINVFGNRVEHNLSETGGQINLEYTIDSDMRLISKNSVNISINEV